MTNKGLGAVAAAAILLAGAAQAQVENDFLEPDDDPALLAGQRDEHAPPTPPGLQNGPGAGKVTFGELIVSGIRAGVTPTETLTTNGRPGAGGSGGSGGDTPGKCPLCGMDSQGTEAQGAAPDQSAKKAKRADKGAKKGAAAAKKADKSTATARNPGGLEANGTEAQGAARE